MGNNVKKLSAERIRPIRDEVYHRIREAILRGVYKPGDKLQEETLAEELGTSRTPVREALRKLEVENLVTYYPHKGTVVSAISIDEIDELCQIRTLLEIFMVRRAAKRAAPKDVETLRNILKKTELSNAPEEILDAVEEFNNFLFGLSGAETLINLNGRIREILRRMLTNNHLNFQRGAEARAEHSRIVDALEANDPDLAERYTKEHLARVPRTLIK
jgi:DNA-binding GntR family transcriptional regulator